MLKQIPRARSAKPLPRRRNRNGVAGAVVFGKQAAYMK